MAVAITYIGAGRSGANAVTYDFGNFNAATGGLMVVVFGGWSAIVGQVASVSIGGGAATIVTQNLTDNGYKGCIATRVVASGNQDVSVTLNNASNSFAGMGVAVYLVTGANATVFATDKKLGGTSFSFSYNTKSGGAVIAGGVSDNANTWGSLTSDIDTNVNGEFLSSAHGTPGSDETPHAESVTFSGNNISWFGAASFAPGGTSYTAALDTGVFALSGKALTVKRGIILTLATGAFALSGKALTVGRVYGLLLGTGIFSLVGKGLFPKVKVLPIHPDTTKHGPAPRLQKGRVKDPSLERDRQV